MSNKNELNDEKLMSITADKIESLDTNECHEEQIKRLKSSLHFTFNSNIQCSKTYSYNRQTRTRKESKHETIDEKITPFKLLLQQM